MSGGTTRDVWAQMGLGERPNPSLPAEAAPAPPPARRPTPAPRPPRTRAPIAPSTQSRPLDSVGAAPAAIGRHKERVARPVRLQINITARAERLIRAGVEAKRAQGLRGHDASITAVVEEALELALGRLAPADAHAID